jgi:phosphonate transport system substrate-binding protein
VWETLKLHHPEVTDQTRVAYRSVKYGHPPFVTRLRLPETDYKQLQSVLVGMRSNPAGQDLLRRLNLEGFQIAPESVFNGIAENMHMLHLG